MGTRNAINFTDKGRAAEAILKMSELKAVFLEPAFCYKNFASWVPLTHENGEFIFNLSLDENTKLHCFDVTQMGQVVATVLHNPDPFVAHFVPLWGDALTGVSQSIRINSTGLLTCALHFHTQKEFAKQFSEVTGQPARWKSLTYKELEKKLEGRRLVHDQVLMWKFIKYDLLMK